MGRITAWILSALMLVNGIGFNETGKPVYADEEVVTAAAEEETEAAEEETEADEEEAEADEEASAEEEAEEEAVEEVEEAEEAIAHEYPVVENLDRTVSADVDAVVKRLEDGFDELTGQIGTYEEYIEKLDLIEDYYQLVGDETNALYLRSLDNAMGYVRTLIDDGRYAEDGGDIEEIYEVISTDAAEEIFNEIYDNLLNDLSESFLNGILQDMQDEIDEAEDDEFTQEEKDELQALRDQAFERQSALSDHVYGLYYLLQDDSYTFYDMMSGKWCDDDPDEAEAFLDWFTQNVYLVRSGETERKDAISVDTAEVIAAIQDEYEVLFENIETFEDLQENAEAIRDFYDYVGTEVEALTVRMREEAADAAQEILDTGSNFDYMSDDIGLLRSYIFKEAKTALEETVRKDLLYEMEEVINGLCQEEWNKADEAEEYQYPWWAEKVKADCGSHWMNSLDNRLFTLISDMDSQVGGFLGDVDYWLWSEDTVEYAQDCVDDFRKLIETVKGNVDEEEDPVYFETLNTVNALQEKSAELIGSIASIEDYLENQDAVNAFYAEIADEVTDLCASLAGSYRSGVLDILNSDLDANEKDQEIYYLQSHITSDCNDKVLNDIYYGIIDDLYHVFHYDIIEYASYDYFADDYDAWQEITDADLDAWNMMNDAVGEQIDRLNSAAYDLFWKLDEIIFDEPDDAAIQEVFDSYDAVLAGEYSED